MGPGTLVGKNALRLFLDNLSFGEETGLYLGYSGYAGWMELAPRGAYGWPRATVLALSSPSPGGT